MREFQAWHIKEKYMFNVSELAFLEGGIYVYGPGVGEGWSEVNEKFKNENEVTIILRESIGLRDKNGKEIYKGDILQSHKDIMGEIVWHPTKAMFYWRYKNIWGNRDVKKGYRPKYFNKKMEYVVKNCEVIGNIYGDKDLLA